MEAPRGAREPTGTNGPTLNTNTSTTNVYTAWLTDTKKVLVKPLYGSQPTQTPTPNTRHTLGGIEVNMVEPTCGGHSRGETPSLHFRTWKLSPQAPMVLHLGGCGRVGHRHNTLTVGSWNTMFQDPTAFLTPTTHTTPATTSLTCSLSSLSAPALKSRYE